MADENDIRAAFRSLADEAPEPGTMLTAVLTTPPVETGQTRAARRRRRAAPLAAATAVVAIVATSVVIGTSSHRGGPARIGEADRSGLPPYYVAINGHAIGSQRLADVRATESGALLATVHPPHGLWFMSASPGPGNRSFLLEVVQFNRFLIYLLRFDPANDTTSLRMLPIPALQTSASLAMSPNGTEVALSARISDRAGLWIYALSGRLIRQWHGSGALCPAVGIGVPCLSWATTGYLAFSWWGHPKDSGVRLLRASAASGSLVGASRLVVPSSRFVRTRNTVAPLNLLMSANGRTIVSNVQVRPAGARAWRYESFSVATGKLTGRFWAGISDSQSVPWWTNSTGSQLIVTGWKDGVLTSQEFTPLPLGPTRSLFDYAF